MTSKAANAQANVQAPVKQANLFGVLAPYKALVALLIGLALLSNGLNLILPQLIRQGIDAFGAGAFDMKLIVIEFAAASIAIFVFTYLQSIVQTYASERVARDMRERLAGKISEQTYEFVQAAGAGKLLTNLTSDIDAVKMFVSMGIVSLCSSFIIIVGASVLLFRIDWKLTLAVLAIVPLIAVTFFIVMSKMRPLFKRTQEVIDWLNKVINESIMGSGLIRVLNSQMPEYDKFVEANTNAKDLGLQILRMFAVLIPVISFVANLAVLVILLLGGRFVIEGAMTLGDFAAFMSYLSLLIFPIIVIGFMSNVISRAQASYQRVAETTEAAAPPRGGAIDRELRGDIAVEGLTVTYGEKSALKNVSLSIHAKTRTAIIGPTAAGKTQLLYALTGLLTPQSGAILFDGIGLDEYDPSSLRRQAVLVFQDSVMFNMTLRDNIAFGGEIKNDDFDRAVKTAELADLVAALPEGFDTLVSERGTSLSGGQKQRIMLARALALNPKILFLDEFTARVDAATERKILQNIRANYPDLTLVSVTQTIAPVMDYDTIALIMEGEILAQGTHKELMESSPEYVQIFESQKSTSHYETAEQ
ncbi:MAG TPA: ABC transporter ATP-binding protein [Candidatus Paceibacterota bacterium]|nr:ABC transporter ATP-binding protein [Candidatus Paceibacterota bacterium]